MKNIKVVFLLVFMLILFAACTPAGDGEVEGTSIPTLDPGIPTLTALPAEPTSTIDIEASYGLTYMREEEKLARDIYQVLFEKWAARVFENITQSEQQHMDQVGTLLSSYFITDPAADTLPGQFTNPTLQALYDELFAQGSISLSEAFKVSAAIEELDILDLQHFLEGDLPGDVRLVYENLLEDSYNHLTAFSYLFERESGIIYSPIYMTTEAYNEAIALGSSAGHGDGAGGYRGTATP